MMRGGVGSGEIRIIHYELTRTTFSDKKCFVKEAFCSLFH